MAAPVTAEGLFQRNVQASADIFPAHGDGVREVCDDDAGDEAEQMALPRDAFFLGQDSIEHRPMRNDDDQRDPDCSRAEFEDGSGDQKAEEAEHETACADVSSRPPEEPHRDAGEYRDRRRHAQKVRAATRHQQCAQKQQCARIRHQVLEGSMDERRAEDTTQAIQLSRIQYEANDDLGEVEPDHGHGPDQADDTPQRYRSEPYGHYGTPRLTPTPSAASVSLSPSARCGPSEARWRPLCAAAGRLLTACGTAAYGSRVILKGRGGCVMRASMQRSASVFNQAKSGPRAA